MAIYCKSYNINVCVYLMQLRTTPVENPVYFEYCHSQRKQREIFKSFCMLAERVGFIPAKRKWRRIPLILQQKLSKRLPAFQEPTPPSFTITICSSLLFAPWKGAHSPGTQCYKARSAFLSQALCLYSVSVFYAPAAHDCNSTRPPLRERQTEAKQQMRNHPQICRKQHFGTSLVCNQHST